MTGTVEAVTEPHSHPEGAVRAGNDGRCRIALFKLVAKAWVAIKAIRFEETYKLGVAQ